MLVLASLFLHAAVGACTAVARQVAAADVTLTAPASPPTGHLIIDPSYVSYSIELCYMQDFAGNESKPNALSIQLLQNFEDISGSLPIIRAGGTTANRAVYYSNQTEGIINSYSGGRFWLDQPTSTTLGPAFFESFQQFPAGTQYIYNVNFYNGSIGFTEGTSGFDQTVLEANAAWNALGESITAFEIGNEVNAWSNSSRRPEGWTQQDYVDEWLDLAKAISENNSLPLPRFQGCAYTAPRNVSVFDDTWNVANAIRAGMNEGSYLKTVADHDYMGANCDGSPRPTLAGNLLNHFRMTSLMYYHQALGNQTKALGIDYVIGETNSISCQGTANVSDVFGSALWSIDYILYNAGTNVSRVFFHMGSQYRYSAWQPITINGTAPYVKPLYYGNLFAAKALAAGDKKVVNLLNTTSLEAYGIYEGDELASVAVVNLQEFNASMPVGERVYTAFTLPEVDGGWDDAEVRRLTAPGVDSKTNITFAGQSVDSDGKIVGSLALEAVSEGAVLVGAGEAVLVTL